MSGAADEELKATAPTAPEKPPAGLGRVRDLLIAKPELIRNDEGLMRALGVRPIAANVVDFGPAALARLEAARSRESSARQEIEQIARANFSAQAKTHEVIVDLLQARNNADLARRVHEAARGPFALAAGAIVLEGPAPAPTGWMTAPAGLVDDLLGPSGRERIGPASAAEVLFGSAGGAIESMALVRLTLWSEGRAGVLAFGSPDPLGFRPDMGGELVTFLARVVERTAERWPVLL
jgi:uncharacterized protein YigA (DUF484 family)